MRRATRSSPAAFKWLHRLVSTATAPPSSSAYTATRFTRGTRRPAQYRLALSRMLPGRAKRSHVSPWHFGHSRGGVTTPSGSKPQQRHCTWNTVTRVMDASTGLYEANSPSDAKRSMLIDIATLLIPTGYTHSDSRGTC